MMLKLGVSIESLKIYYNFNMELARNVYFFLQHKLKEDAISNFSAIFAFLCGNLAIKMFRVFYFLTTVQQRYVILYFTVPYSTGHYLKLANSGTNLGERNKLIIFSVQLIMVKFDLVLENFTSRTIFAKKLQGFIEHFFF